MISSTRMLSKLLFVLAAGVPVLAQNSLATLIQTGNRKAALEKINASLR